MAQILKQHSRMVSLRCILVLKSALQSNEAAAQKGHTAVVEFLVERGANIEAHGGDSTALYV